jgi:UPF0716 protein FxsA
MRLIYILLMLAVPFLELGLLIHVAQSVGFWWTMAIIVGTALLGVAALTNNGFSAPWKMQEAMRRGDTPMAPVLDSALIGVGGVLLITPGLIADALGLLLLVPPARRLLAGWFVRNFMGAFDVEVRTTTWRQSPGEDPRDDRVPPRRPRPPGTGPVIEGEYERLGEQTVDPGRRRPGGEQG